MKEDEVYNMRMIFRVRYDCVYGLKFVNNIYKHHIKGFKIINFKKMLKKSYLNFKSW